MTNEIESGHRVLKAIQDGGHPSRADALVFRIWAGPRTRMGPLDEIAKQVLDPEFATVASAPGKNSSFCNAKDFR